ncbi:MAG TPA: alpha/beta fold hydrolase [Ilumatobacteraceae bacterium]|jgi:3-oxoadipate enol-lactonase|nr:alpha/beta fold hydrolase [Ilumatobacteraceae bacterium]
MTYVRTTDGTRIHYQVTGRPGAPPILFIQGLGADKNGWNLQRLATATSFRSVALDNRGAGRSDKPHGTYTLEQMADDAITVLDHAGVETAHVVGASMGGAISQIVAVKYPERTRSLTLACTAGRNHPWREELLASWRDAALERGIGSMGHEAARWVIGPRSFRRLLPAIGWLGPLALNRPAHAFAAQCNAILAAGELHQDLIDRLPEIAVPTLVLVGNQDILTPRGDSEDLAATIPTAELVVISGAAHGFMVEHASTFNRVLLEFLHRAERSYRERRTEEDRLDQALATG